MSRWMIYGAYGYSGELIAREATARGHRPILAGRRPEPLDRLAEELDCESRPFQLETGPIVERRVGDVDLVLHCAGPFSTTFRPMVEGCIAAGTHYLDITGEIDVLESLARRDRDAHDRGVLVMPAVGFDVVPTDCLALYVHEKLPDAVRLEIAIDALGASLSHGTASTMIENLGRGSRLRRDGSLVEIGLLDEQRQVDFGDGERTCVAIPWGDLATAYRTTGIGDITTYASMSARQRFGLRVAGWFSWLLATRPAQAFLRSRVKPGGPSEEARRTGSSRIWARAESGDGRAVEALLSCPESYAWTARLAVDSVEAVFERRVVGAETETDAAVDAVESADPGDPAASDSPEDDGRESLRAGFLTPAAAFGADFVLGDGVERIVR